MAKGRKHSSDRRERLLGTYGYSENHASGGDLQELREEDVWPAPATAAADSSSDRDDACSSAFGWERSDGDRPSRARRWLGGQERQVGGLSLAFEEAYQPARPTVLHQYRNVDSPAPRGGHHRAVAASAPVNVPDWGRIQRVDSTDSLQGSVEVEGVDGEWIPPHEYLAQEHGKMVTTSVFEGVGRTLKGRDMSRVRDAVWSQTGFFG